MTIIIMELEQFILDNQGALIRDSVDIIQLMKQYVPSAVPENILQW